MPRQLLPAGNTIATHLASAAASSCCSVQLCCRCAPRFPLGSLGERCAKRSPPPPGGGASRAKQGKLLLTQHPGSLASSPASHQWRRMLWGPTRGAGAPGPPAKKQRPNPEAEGGSKPAEQGALAPAVQAAPPPPAATATAAAPAAAAADTSPDQAETYDPVASLPDSPLFLMHTDAEKE